MQSWVCSNCTFRHHANAPRCAMCQELRVSRENMRDFITGKKVTTTTKQSQSSSSATPTIPSQVLASIENVASNQKNTADKAHHSRDLRKSTPPNTTLVNMPNPTNEDTMVQHHSLPSITHNPYCSKSSRLSSGSTAPTSNNHDTNNPSHRPARLFSNISRTNTANVNTTKVTAAKNVVLSTAKKRPHSLSTGSNTKPIPPKSRKRAKSLTKAIVLPYQPGPVPLDMECADTWIYPVVAAYPKRQYQYDITYAAIKQNTLVSLPTGLGKTLIAAVVLYNFYRWYPTGKVLFLAPTLPLVDQQVQACYEIMGIPAADTALLTGKVPAEQRINIWKTRRVFFCTPQTVQRDLEANRCSALQVVCVVLDEAHKSTGEYAYCKVISHLEKAGAKFRVVGLSATPGTSIKAVQNVINVLRINCIEARSDSDPDVRQYIHDRQTDVVVVKGMDATKDVENKLNEIIGPLMDILRKRNVILPQFTDHKAISSYTLLKCQSFIMSQPQNQRDNAAIGYLSAGICFLQIRTDLHKHGIGTVRSKLQKLLNDRPRGPLATIVKGYTFQALWDEVENVSCNPNAIDNNLEDKYKNNPKLKKLCEILMDHFEKSKAASTSSRVIVFSQFRTSVSEIVDVLNESKPLIRARHFIGQGKSGGSAKSGKTNGAEQQLMDGMKQDEQKNVIQRFKDGIYNTLVCTSIGEEGLDIGEVDLIVNFDCLSSPIRTIQRVGRTGRKREGRVVTLVAEGHEERTLAKSKQNEKTLIHALKDPNAFEVAPITPILPNEPAVLERDMAIAINFHMSQVDGARKQTSKRNKKQCTKARPWELSETEEFQRSCILGKISNNMQVFDFEHLRRHFLNARVISYSYHSKRNLLRGKLSSLIKSTESLYPHTKPAPTNNSTLKPKESALENVFPLTKAIRHIFHQATKPKCDKETTTNIDVRSCLPPSFVLKSIPLDAEEQARTREISSTLTETLPPIESTETTSVNIRVQNENRVSSEILTPHKRTVLMDRTDDMSRPTPSVPSADILRSSASRVRFSLDNSKPNETSLTCDSQEFFVAESRKKIYRLAIDDTPESAVTKQPATNHVEVESELQDSQETYSLNQYLCAICCTNYVSDENPIILCDGSGHHIDCDLVVHRNCYSATCIVSEDKEWRCDRCQHIFEGGLANMVKCYQCNLMDGVLKKTVNGWEHFVCSNRSIPTLHACLLEQSSGLCKTKQTNQRSSPIQVDNSPSPETLLREKKHRRKLVMKRFIDYEAEASDDDDEEELEERQIRAIEKEEDELAGNFINDTSQLGFSPDNLDSLPLEQSQVFIDTTATTHRVLDMEREKTLQFATPVLNRRMVQHRDADEGSYDSCGPPDLSTAPDSTHGLGNMNFVRSVLEHHRKGGSTDEIEAFYQDLESEQNEVVNVADIQ